MSLYAEAFQNGTFEQAADGTDEFMKNCYSGNTPNFNSSSCTSYLKKATNDYLTSQMERKDNSIGASLAFSQRIFDADKNASYALIRNTDLLNAQTFARNYNEGIENRITTDLDVTKRQFEINEYHYHNKLDTLFFLQLLFIAILVMAILVYGNRTGYLSTNTTGLLTVALGVVLVIVGISRYFYTIRTRDRRLWHRRYFPTEKPTRPDLLSTCGPSAAPTTINLNAIFSPEQITCAEEASTAVGEWRNRVNAETAAYITGGVDPSSIFQTADVRLPASCMKK